jgi:hypothetical protein
VATRVLTICWIFPILRPIDSKEPSTQARCAGHAERENQMKRLMLAWVGVFALVTSSGCCCLDRLWCHHWGWCPWGGCGEEACGEACGAGGECATGCGDSGCTTCGPAGMHAGHGMIGHHHQHAPGQGHFGTDARAMAGAGGPPTGAVAYPYYTNRGPRDFLAENPPSIGP